jgi:hypothetical protein
MAKRNDYDGRCDVCGAQVKANEGTKVSASESPHGGQHGYLILCVEHSDDRSFEAPPPPEASKLPSIHSGDEKYER